VSAARKISPSIKPTYTDDDHRRDELTLCKLADRYDVKSDDPGRMWHDLALTLARRYERDAKFRIPWHGGEPRRPGPKARPDRQLLTADRLIKRIQGICKRTGWTERDPKTGKVIRAGRKLSVRKACEAVSLLESGKAKSEQKAVDAVFSGLKQKGGPDIYSRYQRARALTDRRFRHYKRDQHWQKLGILKNPSG
jgi:hypothetical protein